MPFSKSSSIIHINRDFDVNLNIGHHTINFSIIHCFVLYQIKLYKEIRKLRGRLIEVADRGRVLDAVTSNRTCG